MAWQEWWARRSEPPPLWPTAACAVVITLGFAGEIGTVPHTWAGWTGRSLMAVAMLGLWVLTAWSLRSRR
jgi:hypothetical protein